MSRWGEDTEDRYGIDDLRPNASCSDCGVEYAKASDDPTTWCDRCSTLRDTWATALEQRHQLQAALDRGRRWRARFITRTRVQKVGAE